MEIRVTELSPQAFRAASSQVAAYRDALVQKLDRLVEGLARIGVEAAVEAVRVDTGLLRSSIRAEHRAGGYWLVIAEAPYVAFVEFGTGVVGSGTYPKELPLNWEYDMMQTPSAHDPYDPSKWYYYDDEGYLHSTRGQTANAFMGHASDEMRNRVLEVAREVFS